MISFRFLKKIMKDKHSDLSDKTTTNKQEIFFKIKFKMIEFVNLKLHFLNNFGQVVKQLY
eukprot:TRINITY_DN3171_c3_g6_i1.p1 TRINITY_DN3171_c3_g6~~TRINITY_DN3171_c3_g6_i1.p1  ORF type:complete len:60 (+),score=14.61 TRINITY_DN3171_c3_g6_i1:316-495(+)